MWVEVEDDALRRLRRRDDPAAVLVRRVLQRVAGGGDVAGVAGVQVAAARLRGCGGRRQSEEALEWQPWTCNYNWIPDC